MEDRFETGERGRIIEDLRGESLSVDRAVPGNPWECRFDSGHRCAAPAEQPVNNGIRIVHGDPERTKHARGVRFAHADGAGQTKDYHFS
jgi:hypothetical protein